MPKRGPGKPGNSSPAQQRLPRNSQTKKIDPPEGPALSGPVNTLFCPLSLGERVRVRASNLAALYCAFMLSFHLLSLHFALIRPAGTFSPREKGRYLRRNLKIRILKIQFRTKITTCLVGLFLIDTRIPPVLAVALHFNEYRRHHDGNCNPVILHANLRSLR